MKKNSYVTPTLTVLAILSESGGILADSGKYNASVDGEVVTGNGSSGAIEGNPDEIDAKEHQSSGVWDD